MIKKISFLLILFYTFSFSQNKNNTNYFPPEKLENRLGQTFLLNTYYSLSYPENGFSINHPVSFAKVYEEFSNEQNSQNTKELLAEIHFNKLGKLNTVKKYPDNDNSIIIYNEKGLTSFIIDQNKEYDNIAEFTYNEIGNLISQYDYYKKEQGLEFHSYTEYKYHIENGNTVVQEFKLEKYTGSAVEKSKITFDKQQRMIREERSLYIPNKKELNYKRSYHYDNLKFPEKITKKETYNLVGNNKAIELFEYNDNGDLIYSYLNSDPQKLIISEKNTYLSKNEIEKIIIIKEPNKKEEKRHNLITLDDSGNIIYDKEISQNKDNNFFTKNTYKFDNHKNWIELLIQQHNYLAREGGKDDESGDEYIKYIREINYSDFEDMHSPKIVDTKASEQLKKEKLEKSKYYEQIKNMK
jgi:hypothetical protein